MQNAKCKMKGACLETFSDFLGDAKALRLLTSGKVR